FAAWAETDPAQRAALLRHCAAEDVTYTDIHAATTDRTQLSEWMAACRGFFPNVRVVRSGSVLNCRGALLVRWRVEGPQGEVFGTGTNTARITMEGRLRSVIAFWEP
ncbi:MAG: hypothetical protein KC729_15220, partial [Candidatus Eisenbacteria bacterium]|nr:hypothetical protein [Candidatus Eisenbacteria bacterium]